MTQINVDTAAAHIRNHKLAEIAESGVIGVRCGDWTHVSVQEKRGRYKHFAVRDAVSYRSLDFDDQTPTITVDVFTWLVTLGFPIRYDLHSQSLYPPTTYERPLTARDVERLYLWHLAGSTLQVSAVRSAQSQTHGADTGPGAPPPPCASGPVLYDAHLFQNALRILRSTDKHEVPFLSVSQFVALRDDTLEFLIRMDEPTADKIWAHVQSRQVRRVA